MLTWAPSREIGTRSAEASSLAPRAYRDQRKHLRRSHQFRFKEAGHPSSAGRGYWMKGMTSEVNLTLTTE